MSHNLIIVICTLLFLLPCYAQNDFNYVCPSKYSMLPSGCLESMRVKNPTRTLQINERRQLIQIFIKAHLTNKRKYKQDYLLNPNAEIYQLLKTNYPDLKQYEREGGIFIGSIYQFLKSTPEFKADIRKNQ